MLKLNGNRKPIHDDLGLGSISSQDIAVIGLSLRFPRADHYKQFWRVLCGGEDCITNFPEERKKDAKAYLKWKDSKRDHTFRVGAYINRIDSFDYSFFKIPYKEASLMDPNQRIFLETVWQCIEDAGYSPKDMENTKTGVFMGYSGNSEYQTFLSEISPEDIILSEAGNIDSIIASRISYLLDLKGPSMLIDTACSSSLAAVHMACQSIRSKESDMAIAGGCKIWFMPLELEQKLGIESSTGRAHTFDDQSDGTGFGEGVAAILLKPLNRALKDRNHVYAVIKGSGMNQDGNSVGITAPNMQSQEELLATVWEKSSIPIEKLTYMEAHGTGTTLGDPIEVNAINKAFQRYTNKKQFCGIGSVKSTIGHLDHGAGIAGFVKAVLSIHYGALPPTLHFSHPNRKIDFINSAVYVGDELSEWKGDERYCGVSSFGLSGTNCHVVLGRPPIVTKEEQVEGETYVLTLSAKNKESLVKLANAYLGHLRFEKDRLIDVCYTASLGRDHFNHRLAVAAKSKKECMDKITYFLDENRTYEDLNIWYGRFYVAQAIKEVLDEDEVYENDIIKMTEKVKEEMHGNPVNWDVDSICRLYTRGAWVEWDRFYKDREVWKVSLPTYAFAKSRCWIQIPGGNTNLVNHPLIDERMSQTSKQEVYRTNFSLHSHWVLKEHKIAGRCIAPGTTYLEMINACMKRYHAMKKFVLRDVLFIQPLIVEEDEEVSVHTIIKNKGGHFTFSIGNEWESFCEGKVHPLSDDVPKRLELQEILKKCNHSDENAEEEDLSSLDFGPRWSKIKKDIHIGENEVFVKVRLPSEYYGDMQEYDLHPSLLDIAVNAITQLTGHGIYLPFSYGGFTVYESIPPICYSYIKINNPDKGHYETISLDVTITDEEGNIVIHADNFIIKKLNQDRFMAASKKEESNYYKISWKKTIDTGTSRDKVGQTTGKTLVFGTTNCIDYDGNSEDVIKVEFARDEETLVKKLGNGTYGIGTTFQAIKLLLSGIETESVTRIIFSYPITHCDVVTEFSQLKTEVWRSLFLVKHVTQAILEGGYKQKIKMVLLSKYAYEVNGAEPFIHSHYAAYLSLGKSLGKEYPNLIFRCLDIDDDTSFQKIWDEEGAYPSHTLIAFRKNEAYVEEISVYKPMPDKDSLFIKKDGVYLITGGTGGIGRELAGYILQKEETARLLLLSRSGMDETQSSSTVDVISCDLGNEESVRRAFRKIKQEYGTITGIFHAAGVAGEGYLLGKKDEKFEEVISPKIYGTWLLDQQTKEYDMDFMICFSSVSSIYGMAGQSDYAAANAYLDSFSFERRKRENKHTISINWAPFKEVGMAKRYELKDDGIFHMLNTKEAFQYMEEIGMEPVSRLTIGRINYNELQKVSHLLDIRLERSLEKRSVNKKESFDSSDLNEVVMKGRKNQAYNSTEKQLANIWNKMLGIVEVDIYTSFQELGGDSIMATAIYKEIDKIFSGIIDITSVFSYPSIYEMANYINGIIGEEEKEEAKLLDALDQLLLKLENGEMMVEEAMKAI